jgi:hypothetical protein
MLVIIARRLHTFGVEKVCDVDSLRCTKQVLSIYGLRVQCHARVWQTDTERERIEIAFVGVTKI